MVPLPMEHPSGISGTHEFHVNNGTAWTTTANRGEPRSTGVEAGLRYGNAAQRDMYKLRKSPATDAAMDSAHHTRLLGLVN